MLQTDQVAQPLHRKGGKPEIFEFPGSIQGGGIINNVVVDVRPVSMGGNDKSVFALQKPLGKLVTDAVGFLRRNLPRLERLPHLISDNITFLAAPGGLLVQPFRQQKFLVYGQRAALVAADQFALLGLVRVLDIAGMVVQTSPDGLAFVLPHGDQPCCCQCHHPLKKKMPHIGGIEIIWIIFRGRRHLPDTWLPAEHFPIRC